MINSDLNEILKNNKFVAYYQPIVDLSTANIYGYEGLIRGPINSSLFYPKKLFKCAEDENLISKLDYQARNAIISSANLLGNKYLHINIDPNIINSTQFSTGKTLEY